MPDASPFAPIPAHDGSHTYAYDAENRLVTVDGGSTATYAYDAQGRRIYKGASSTWTDYFYDLEGQVDAEINPNGFQVGYVYLGGQLLAQYQQGTTYFIHKDHLGSTRVMTTVSGSVSDSMDFMPFGEQIAGDSGTSHKFTGKERDSESGLDDFGARHYSSAIGRFVSVDPTGLSVKLHNPQTLNRYTYVLNNPLAFVDPNGKWSEEVHEQIYREALGGYLSREQLQVIYRASAWVDQTSQGPEDAHKHGMRAPGEDPSVAIADTNAWVNKKLDDAVQVQMAAEGTGHMELQSGALSLFGEAAHAVSDSTSPWHRDANGQPLEWGGVVGTRNLLAAASHGIRERVLGDIGESVAKHEAAVKVEQLWLKFQDELEKAREKRKEEEKKKKEEKTAQ